MYFLFLCVPLFLFYNTTVLPSLVLYNLHSSDSCKPAELVLDPAFLDVFHSLGDLGCYRSRRCSPVLIDKLVICCFPGNGLDGNHGYSSSASQDLRELR